MLTGGGENGYYLAFSAGKDSQALYHIAELAGVKFDAHMNLTSVDPPEVIRFVRQAYPEVDLIKPKKSIYQLAVEKQILPTMRVRWCCAEYKEMSGAGRVTLIGIRHQESSRRAKRNEVEISSRKFSGTLEGLDEYRQELKAKRARRKSKKDGVNITNADQEQTLGCISGKESLLISPIIHWTEGDVWEFLNKVMEVPHCSLYDEGWHRLGCIGCPMSSAKQKQRENIRYPHVKRNWIKAIKAIRNGGVFGREYNWWNIRADWKPARNVRGLLRTHVAGFSIPTQNTGCRKILWGGENWTAPSEQTTLRADYRQSESKICYQPEMVTETSRLDSTNPNTRTSRPTFQNPDAMDAGQSKLGDTSREPTTEYGTKRVFSKLIV